jgi:hypothetical protein
LYFYGNTIGGKTMFKFLKKLFSKKAKPAAPAAPAAPEKKQ